jgi:sugar O-acyltransferase (sialic acid O-acetyltransferase NeuD family)
MQDLLIVGAGVHAAETAEIVGRINRVLPAWNLLGYLAPPSAASSVGREMNGYTIVAAWDKLADYPRAMLATPFDAMEVKDIPRDRLATIVDPSAFVSASARIGPGCVIYPSCFVGLNATLGERVFALSSAVINHDDHLGDRVTVCSNVSLAGNVEVEADCYLGQACTVKQFVRVGKGSLIGMGAVVLRDVPPNSVMVGNPARKLKDRFETV